MTEAQLIATKTDDKTATVKNKPIDMVDSSNGVICNVQQPETETVIPMKNDKQLPPNSNKCIENQRQTNNGVECAIPCNQRPQQRPNCDRKNIASPAIEHDANSVNNCKINVSNVNSGLDEDDPYAELESYLEQVKVILKTH